jgi:hypothetical protein
MPAISCVNPFSNSNMLDPLMIKEREHYDDSGAIIGGLTTPEEKAFWARLVKFISPQQV